MVEQVPAEPEPVKIVAAKGRMRHVPGVVDLASSRCLPGAEPALDPVPETVLLDILIVSGTTGLAVAVPATILVAILQWRGHLEAPEGAPNLVLRGLGFALWLAVAGLFYQSLVVILEPLIAGGAHYVAAPVWLLLAAGGLFAAYFRTEPDESPDRQPDGDA